MTLIDRIVSNHSLEIVDTLNDKAYKVTDLVFELSDHFPDRGLLFLYADNTIEDISLYLSALKSNLTIALLKRNIGNDLKEEMEDVYQPDLIYDPSRKCVQGFSSLSIAEISTPFQIFIHPDNREPLHPKIKLLLSTSGSTGSPKFVKLSEENIRENARSINEYLPIIPEDVVPLNLPINYSYGLSILHSNALTAQKILCGLPDMFSQSFWDIFEKYQCSTLAGVPYNYEMLSRLGFLQRRYPTLRYMTEAGGNLNLHLKKVFFKWCGKQKIQFYIMYGQTEATARISYNCVNDHPNEIDSIGKPIPRGLLKTDPDTQELLYKGPNIFGGYAQTRSDLRTWENIEVLHTGDLAKEVNGIFYITGRLKRIMKLFGNRINLDEIEQYLKNQLPDVMLACSNLNDNHILISMTSDKSLNPQVKELLKEQYKFPSQAIKINNIEEIPLTNNGKVSYEALAGLYLDI